LFFDNTNNDAPTALRAKRVLFFLFLFKNINLSAPFMLSARNWTPRRRRAFGGRYDWKCRQTNAEEICAKAEIRFDSGKRSRPEGDLRRSGRCQRLCAESA
jgi:hypothetical protein